MLSLAHSAVHPDIPGAVCTGRLDWSVQLSVGGLAVLLRRFQRHGLSASCVHEPGRLRGVNKIAGIKSRPAEPPRSCPQRRANSEFTWAGASAQPGTASLVGEMGWQSLIFLRGCLMKLCGKGCNRAIPDDAKCCDQC